MTRLWDRGEPVDAAVARLTAGRDPELDLRLVPYDALASAAHADMLARIRVLTADETAALQGELRAIAAAARAGDFEIQPEEEDGHTAIENRLTERLGDPGRKIHTGRSRNDQVIAALRLWGREALLEQTDGLLSAAARLVELAEEHREISAPGYSHGRQAMPTTLGHLFAAHADALLDDPPWLRRAFRHVNRSPLGSASGFGVSLPLERRMVAERLGFDEVQINTLAVQNDRGRTEHLALGSSLAVAHDLSRLAADLIWYSSDELGCLRLASRLTTGSSIMPQKRNPDLLELMRAGASRIRSRHAEIGALAFGLPSGYHRDLQLTKEPFLEGMQGVTDLLAAAEVALSGLEADPERCRRAILPATAATDALYRRVAAGEPFRSAYREIALDPAAAVEGDPAETWRQRTHLGAPGALQLEPYRDSLHEAERWLGESRDLIRQVWRRFEES